MKESYPEGLRKASLHAINCLAYQSAYSLLDLGLSYRYPEGIPDKSYPLSARVKLMMALNALDDEMEDLFQRKLTEAVIILEKPL